MSHLTRSVLVLAALSLAACGPVEKVDDDGASSEEGSEDSGAGGEGGPVDEDGDGADATVDCDDTDPRVYPGAEETCDGVDNNCDGTVDEDAAVDAPVWYRDGDRDGHGDPAATVVACEAPAGHVAVGGDCDDADAERSPSVAEVCDGVDNNCDGSTDEDTAADAPTWYPDTDDDGFGDEASGVRSCLGPADHLATAGDCDDDDPQVHPSATEVCDGVDNNCDGSTDEDSAADASTWYLDADGDGHGLPSTTTTACVVPAGYSDVSTDCDDSDATTHPGAPEVCGDGVDNNCDTTENVCLLEGAIGAASADVTITGSAAGEAVGHHIAVVGDVNGDGYDDVLVSAEDDTAVAPSEEGAAYLVYGAASGAVSGSDLDDHPAFYGERTGDLFGEAVSPAGDLDGDGYDDLLIGASLWDDPASSQIRGGAAYVIYGGTTAFAGAAESTTADVLIKGTGTEELGAALAGGGDMNGDGYDDIVVHSSNSYSTTETAYLIYGSASGLAAESYASAAAAASYSSSVSGAGSYDRTVELVGDLDGDGTDELMVGGYSWDDSSAGNEGLVQLVYGDTAGHSGAQDMDDIVIESTYSNFWCGYSVDGAGDVDGDGYEDALVGCVLGYADRQGAVYIISGSSTQHSGTNDMVTVASSVIIGAEGGDGLGFSVSGGDLDGDGLSDILLGAPAYDPSAVSAAGAAYLIRGTTSLAGTMTVGDGSSGDEAAAFVGDSTGEWVGYSVDASGDTNGDGINDAIVSAPAADSGAGEVLWFLGSGL